MDQIVETSTDYVLSVEPVAETIRLEFGGETIAETSKALRLNEARYAPVYGLLHSVWRYRSALHPKI